MLRTKLPQDFLGYTHWPKSAYKNVKHVCEKNGVLDKEFTSKDLDGAYDGATLGMYIRLGVLSKVGKVPAKEPITIDVTDTMDYLYEGKRYRAIPNPRGFGYKLEKENEIRWSLAREIKYEGELVRRYKEDTKTFTPKVNVYRFAFPTFEGFVNNLVENIRYDLLN